MSVSQDITNARLGLIQRSLQATAQVSRILARAPKLKPHLLTGARGEDEALFYLRRNGYIIVAQQWKSAMCPGDIDLICWDRDCLCLVEVKTRTSRDEFYTAEGQVDETKRKALRRLGSLYLRRLPTRPANKRIDVVAVYLLPGKPAEFEHFRSAIAWDAD